MKGYSFSINKEFASISFINDTDEKRDMLDKRWSHYPILHKVLNFMDTRGFEVGRDPRIQKYYKCLNKDYWYGKKANLEFKAERYPRGFKLEFFQNVNFENRSGGYYDFDKFEKMPYMIKLMFINETNKIAVFLDSLGIKNDTLPAVKTAEDKIIQHWNVYSFDKPPKGFKLTDMVGQDVEPNYNKTDRDKKEIKNGQLKYFRNSYSGRLQRGIVYHNINNMWWVILNDTEYTNIADFQLFDPTPEDFKIRRKPTDRKPKEYTEKLNQLQKLSNKELIRELKKRGIKVS